MHFELSVGVMVCVYSHKKIVHAIPRAMVWEWSRNQRHGVRGRSWDPDYHLAIARQHGIHCMVVSSYTSTLSILTSYYTSDYRTIIMIAFTRYVNCLSLS